MIFIIDFLINRDQNKLFTYAVVGCLIIGTITPMFEFMRGINTVIIKGNIRAVADEIITFSDKNPENFMNFMGKKEESVFIKYIIKNQN